MSGSTIIFISAVAVVLILFGGLAFAMSWAGGRPPTARAVGGTTVPPAHQSPWRKPLLLGIKLLCLVLLVIGVIAGMYWLLGYFGFSLHEVDDFLEIPRIKSILRTFVTPYWISVTVILFAAILFALKKHRYAGLLIAVLVIGLLGYSFRPELSCSESDLACKVTQAQKETEAAAEKQRQEEREAKKKGFDSFRINATIPEPKCTGIVQRYDYETTWKEVALWDTCALDFILPGHCIYVWVDGESKPRPEQYCHKAGETKIIPKRVRQVRAVGDATVEGYIQRSSRTIF